MESRFRFLIALVSLVFLGFLGLALVYLLEVSNRFDYGLTVEFMPVMVIGFCNMILAFTAGECFGLLRYQFKSSTRVQEAAPEPFSENTFPQRSDLSLKRLALRSVGVLFLLVILFYYLRAGFTESLPEKFFLTFAPVFLVFLLYSFVRQVYLSHFMPLWYFRLKQITLIAALLGISIANIKLFFPNLLAF